MGSLCDYASTHVKPTVIVLRENLPQSFTIGGSKNILVWKQYVVIYLHMLSV